LGEIIYSGEEVREQSFKEPQQKPQQEQEQKSEKG
jgi:hypothetical protein